MINFKLDPKTGTPFYRQIIDQITFGIAAGNLKTGEQLPTVRSLAVDLKVNLNTVAKAYKELEIQRALQDGDLVTVHSRVAQKPGDLGGSVVHIFRFKENRIVELWDVGQAVPENSSNECGMF